MSIVTLERLRLRIEREFFMRALADLDAAEQLLAAPPAAPAQLAEWAGLPAACSALRRGAFSARRLAAALRRDRAGLQRRLAALVENFGAAEAWVPAVAERLARPSGIETAARQGHLNSAHA